MQATMIPECSRYALRLIFNPDGIQSEMPSPETTILNVRLIDHFSKQGEIIVSAEKLRLQQVLFHLLSNQHEKISLFFNLYGPFHYSPKLPCRATNGRDF